VAGTTPANLSYSTDVPAGFVGESLNLNNPGNNPTTAAVLISNTAAQDAGYAPTFDDIIANKFTIAFWAKTTASYAQQWIPFITKRGEDTQGFQVRRHGGDAQETFTLRGTGLLGNNDDPRGSVDISTTINVWRHFAAVWDGYSGTRQVYVNGVLDPSINLTNDFGPFALARNHHLVIGSRENNQVTRTGVNPVFDGNMAFNGRLYDVRIYNYPLTSTQVQSLLTPAPAPALTVHAGSGGTIQISWPVSAIGYVLQSSSSVDVGWANSSLTVTTQGNQNVVTDTTGAGARFYRLYLP
jgi:hypothetical protein